MRFADFGFRVPRLAHRLHAQLGFDNRRANAIHADFFVRVVQRHRVRQPADSRLRRAVRRAVFTRHQAENRADIDDRSAARPPQTVQAPRATRRMSQSGSQPAPGPTPHRTCAPRSLPPPRPRCSRSYPTAQTAFPPATAHFPPTPGLVTSHVTASALPPRGRQSPRPPLRVEPFAGQRSPLPLLPAQAPTRMPGLSRCRHQ